MLEVEELANGSLLTFTKDKLRVLVIVIKSYYVSFFLFSYIALIKDNQNKVLKVCVSDTKCLAAKRQDEYP